MLSAGVVLHGRYRLTQPVAAGGMGEVWRAEDLLLHREIAVKVLLPGLMSDRQFVARFRAEARMMAALRHPGIAPIHDYGENAAVDGQRFDYLVMEFVDGTPLSTRIQEAGRLGAAETMAVVAQVADALQAAHEAGIVHRDVKPNNLLLRPGGEVVLVDFGVARSDGMTGLTGTNVVIGSAHYMAPEQAEGRPVSAVTDVYALGAVAFTCLAGRPPYVGDSALAVLAQLVHGQPPVLPTDVPAEVAALVSRAMAKDPAQRYASASDLAAAARTVASETAATESVAVEPVLSDTAVAASPPTTPVVADTVVAASPPTTIAATPLVPLRKIIAEPLPEARRWNIVAVGGAVAALLAVAGAWGGRLLNEDGKAPESPGSLAVSSAPPTSSLAPSVTAVRDYTPVEICSVNSSPYRIVTSKKMKTSRGAVQGVAYLLYSDTEGSYCAVTMKEKGVGKGTEASVAVHVKGELGFVFGDGGGRYAVMVSGKGGACVRWTAWVGALAYVSEKQHCGGK